MHRGCEVPLNERMGKLNHDEKETVLAAWLQWLHLRGERS